ncbi:N-acetyltransferase [Actinokineospora sp. NBRC 105648]|uniref:N-acetyltransferase n=1 Tax=Actinokineospora sp. NBRC 105648 TaxID=3032206 RepID=UPI002557374E|nr:N-acetyltransferase [Actinokineospora sp. NBRC 105648]
MTLAERPDLDPWLDVFPGGWPEFMLHDPIAALYYNLAGKHYAEHVLIAYDRDHPDRAVAKAYTVPFHWDEDVLPPGGWDRVIQRATLNRGQGDEPNLVSALEISIQTDHRGSGLAAVMLEAMRANVRRLGFDTLVAPVRPNGKPDHPDVPMGQYAAWTRADGLPVDPWLRVHVRAGGTIEAVAVRSMTIAGTLPEWRAWTGLPFDQAGPVHVPGALVPVHCDLTHDHAVYIEPNVWVRHRT